MAELPPGPPLPSAVQAYLWAYRYPEFTAWAHRRYGPTYTARVGGLPPSVVTTDRDVIRRLFTGDPNKKRHANDILREALGDRSLLLLEPAEHLARRKLLSNTARRRSRSAASESSRTASRITSRVSRCAILMTVTSLPSRHPSSSPATSRSINRA